MWAHIGTYCYNGGAHVVSPGSHANLGKNKYVGNKVYFLAIRSGAQRGIRQPRGPKCCKFSLLLLLMMGVAVVVVVVVLACELG